jgi:hypothetical protein
VVLVFLSGSKNKGQLDYLLDLIANESHARKTPIRIDTISFGVFDRASPLGKIKLSAIAILRTMPKKPAYFEIASFVSRGVGKNISSILSTLRRLY